MPFLSTLILVGAVQGIISSALLFRSARGKILSNRLLAALILIFSMACLNIYLMQTGIRYQSGVANVIAYIFPFLLVMPVGPLLYLYCLSITRLEFKLQRSHRIHFYAVIIDLVPYIAGFFLVTGIVPKGDKIQWQSFIDQYNTYIDLLRWTSVALYLYFSWKHIRQGNIAGTISPWMRQFLCVFSAFQFIWFTHLVPYLIPAWQDQLLATVDWYPIYLPLVAIVYWLGINGYIHTFVSSSRKEQKNIETSLTAEQIARTQQQLMEAMEHHRLYLDPDLNLERMVKHTGIPQKTISSVLNQHVGKSFNEFVNEYRVTELQKRLTQPGHKHLTIMGLALECGFNSQATMQRSFKQITNLSPREYQLKHQAKSVETSLKSGFE
jgi:AraC-like DNA-binding protein